MLNEIHEKYGRKLAQAALELGAIRLNVSVPFTWASGYKMPIYNDNRQFLSSAEYRKIICEAFCEMRRILDIRDIDNIAGTSTAGIPHATTLADRMNKPLSYVRSSAKDHGMGRQIEGLTTPDYAGAHVLLIEDLISTGSSSVNAVNAIRNADGICNDCLAIFTYGLKKSAESFGSLAPVCRVHTILTYEVMIETAVSTGYITADDAESLREWRSSPFTWQDRFAEKKEK